MPCLHYTLPSRYHTILYRTTSHTMPYPYHTIPYLNHTIPHNPVWAAVGRAGRPGRDAACGGFDAYGGVATIGARGAGQKRAVSRCGSVRCAVTLFFSCRCFVLEERGWVVVGRGELGWGGGGGRKRHGGKEGEKVSG